MSQTQMKCPECGKQLRTWAKNCPHCGCPLSEDTASAKESEGPRCAKCGAALQPDATKCPNCGQVVGAPVEKPKKVRQHNTGTFNEKFLSATRHVLYRVVFFVLILPFNLWKRAVERLDDQRRNKLLDTSTIEHEVPFFVWLKRFLFDFIFDGIAMFGWLIGIVITMAHAFNAANFSLMADFVVPLLITYYIPLVMAIMRDTLTFVVVMPVRWLLSYLRRPAKTVDINHSGSIKQSFK